MGYQSYIKKLYKSPKENLGAVWKERLIQLRRAPTVNRVEHPTRIDKAHAYGYKAKKGFIITQVKVVKGGRTRPHLMSGRKPINTRTRLILRKNQQSMAEVKAATLYRNCEVLGSYWISEDGNHVWYEVILADRDQVSTYAGYEWLKDAKGRTFRGITSAGRKYRGLRHKGKGSEKTRPSLNANKGRGN